MQIFSANGAKLLELLIFYYFLTYMCALGARARVARNFPTRRLFFQIFLLNFFFYNFLEKYPEIFHDILKKYSKIGSKIKVFFLCGTSLCDTSLFEVEGGQGDVWKVLVTDEQVTLTGGMQEVCIPVSHKFYI